MAKVTLDPGILFNLNGSPGNGQIPPGDIDPDQIKAFIEAIDHKTLKFNISFEINRTELNKSSFEIEDTVLAEKGYMVFDTTRVTLKRKKGEKMNISFSKVDATAPTVMTIELKFLDGKIRGVGV